MTLDDLLKSVSRSFYLSVCVLPAAVRPVVGLAYLLCRAADTLADTPVLDPPQRLRFLREFDQLFFGFPFSRTKAEQLVSELKEANLAPSTAEGQLIAHLNLCLDTFIQLTHTDQALTAGVVHGVVQGMVFDLTTFREGAGVRALATDTDLENYLGWIGGEPGRFWTKACLDHLPGLKIGDRGRWLEEGVRFGTGLQMVNILRDLTADLKLGRCYIPEARLAKHGLSAENLLSAESNSTFLPLYHDLIGDAVSRLSSGVDYLYQLPVTAFRLRAAVWWPLSLGLMTLARLRDSYNVLGRESPQKVSRWQVYRLVVSSPFVLSNDLFLRWDFEDLQQRALP